MGQYHCLVSLVSSILAQSTDGSLPPMGFGLEMKSPDQDREGSSGTVYETTGPETLAGILLQGKVEHWASTGHRILPELRTPSV